MNYSVELHTENNRERYNERRKMASITLPVLINHNVKSKGVTSYQICKQLQWPMNRSMEL